MKVSRVLARTRVYRRHGAAFPIFHIFLLSCQEMEVDASLPSRPESHKGQRTRLRSDPQPLAARTICEFAQRPHSRGQIEAGGFETRSAIELVKDRLCNGRLILMTEPEEKQSPA